MSSRQSIVHLIAGLTILVLVVAKPVSAMGSAGSASEISATQNTTIFGTSAVIASAAAGIATANPAVAMPSGTEFFVESSGISAQNNPTIDLRERVLQTILDKARQSLEADGVTSDRIRIELAPRWIPARLTRINPDLIRSVTPKPGPVRGFHVFEVRTPNGVTEVQLHVQVEHYLPVIAERVMSGELIEADDFVWRWIDVTQQQADLLQDPDQAIGLQLRRTTLAGQPIRLSDLWETPAIEAGTEVTLIFESAGMQVSLPVQARQAGHPGDQIRVYSISTRRTYLAEIRGPGEVVWRQTL
jgi:flagella basal body P-ring formation protein FlgA